MGLKITRERIDTEEEKKLLINCITDTSFLKQIIHVASADYFQLPYAKIVFKWIKEYFDKYSEAPNKQISDLFISHKVELDESTADLIEEFLRSLNELFEQGYNREYYTDVAERYLKLRSIKIHAEKLQSLTTLGKIEEAEDELINFKKIAKATSTIVNPHDEEYIRNTFNKTEDESKLFTLPNAVGELTGWFKRGWLVLYEAPYKSGKSFFLNELQTRAALNRLKVLHISLEMTDAELSNRYWRRISGSPNESGEYVLTEFDCLKNQDNSCKIMDRTCNVSIGNNVDHIPGKYPKGYRPCTFCRKKELRENYRVGFFRRKRKKNAITDDDIIRKSSAILRTYGDNVRIATFPRGSINIRDIEHQLEILEYSENWNCDVLIVDYAQIMAAENKKHENEEVKLNESILALAGLAAKKKCLVISVLQLKTEALKKSNRKMGDASGSARGAYAHSAYTIGLAQTNDEKEMGIMRMNVIAGRHAAANEDKEVYLLQQLDLGISILDSEWLDN